jgi:hypothetical protein
MGQNPGRERGSQRMLQELFGSSKSPSNDEIKRALGLTVDDVEVRWWWWKGTPPMFIELYAELGVERERAGQVVQRLIGDPQSELSVEVSSIGAQSQGLTLNVSNVPTMAR